MVYRFLKYISDCLITILVCFLLCSVLSVTSWLRVPSSLVVSTIPKTPSTNDINYGE